MSEETHTEQRATELFLAEDYVAAEQMYRAMLDEEPENAQIMLMLGLCRRGQGDQDGALSMIEQSTNSPHGEDLNYFYLGMVLAEQQRGEDALVVLDTCLSMNPNNAPARALIGYLQLQHGRVEEAIPSLVAAIRANPDNPAALTSLALAHLEKGDLDKAYKYAQAAVKLKPKEAATQAALGKVLLAQGHLAFAEQCLNNALKTSPQNPELHATMAGVQRKKGDHQLAAAHYAHAAKAGYGGSKLLVEMSESLVRMGQTEDALKLLSKVQVENPEDEQINLLMAQLSLDRGDLETAQALAGRLNRDNPVARILLAELAQRQGQDEQAESLLAAVDTAGQAGLAERATLVSARLAVARGEHEQAIDLLRPLCDQEQPSLTAGLILFDLLREQGEGDLAATLLERLIQQHPRMSPALLATCHRLAGDLLDEQGLYDRAAGHLGMTGQHPAPIMKQLVTQRDDARHQAWLAESKFPWTAPDDGLSSPVIILGWPGSGRAPLMAALAAAEGANLLDVEQGQYRANSLLIPADPDTLRTLSDEEIRQGRANYFMSDMDLQSDAVQIESVWWESVNLASLARFFPGAKVIRPVAELADLELMWRLSGYGDIPHLLELWEIEERLLDHFKATLPLEFVEIDRGALFSEPSAALETLGTTLGLEVQPSMAERLTASIHGHRLRPSGHSRHYRQVLCSMQA